MAQLRLWVQELVLVLQAVVGVLRPTYLNNSCLNTAERTALSNGPCVVGVRHRQHHVFGKNNRCDKIRAMVVQQGAQIVQQLQKSPTASPAHSSIWTWQA